MILVTAFKPFLNESINPSQKILEALQTFPHTETLLLPVEYDGAFNNLQIHLSRNFNFILMLGQGGGFSNKIRLERVALNLEDSPNPDESGTIRKGHLIEVSGPPAMMSDLHLAQWAQNLGSNAEVSNHAGTYVCNSLYYKTMRHSKIPCLFTHLPFLPEQIEGKPTGTKSLTFEEMLSPIQNLMELLLAKYNQK